MTKKHAENLIKVKTSAIRSAKFTHMKDWTSQRELSETATPEEIKNSLRKQEVTDYKRITTRRCGEEIQTHTYILTFNKSMIPKEVKIGFYLKRVKQYISTSLKCCKCQKYGIHKESCRGWLIYEGVAKDAKVREKSLR